MNKKKNFYRKYVCLLGVLFIILFVLIFMAVGMVKKAFFPASEAVTKKENSTTEYTEAAEISVAVDKKETQSDDEESTETDDVEETKISMEKEALLVLVNQTHPIPEDWEINLKALPEDMWIDERVYPDLMQMLSDAEKAGLEPVICSAYRSREVQQELYDEDIAYYTALGYSEEAAKALSSDWLAVPGTSEHELGLALDIVSKENQRLEQAQEDTKEQQWLMAHCYDYGFILRYPKDKEEITGISYEPWHYRYVGKAAAQEIKAQGVCLEEYLAEEKR